MGFRREVPVISEVQMHLDNWLTSCFNGQVCSISSHFKTKTGLGVVSGVELTYCLYSIMMEMSVKSKDLLWMYKMSVLIIVTPYLSFSRQLVCWPLGVFFSVHTHILWITEINCNPNWFGQGAPGECVSPQSQIHSLLLIADDLSFDWVVATVIIFFYNKKRVQTFSS